MRSIYSRFVRDYLVPDDRDHTEGHFKLTEGIRTIQKEMPDSKEEINIMIDTLKSHGLLGAVKRGATAIPFTAAVEVTPLVTGLDIHGVKFTDEPVKVLMELNTNKTFLEALDRDEVKLRVTYLSGMKPLMDAVSNLEKLGQLNMEPKGELLTELHPVIHETLKHLALGFNGNVMLTNHEVSHDGFLCSTIYGSLEELAEAAQVTLSEIHILTQDSEYTPNVLHRGPYAGCYIEYLPDYGDPYQDTNEDTIDQGSYSSEWDDVYNEDVHSI